VSYKKVLLIVLAVIVLLALGIYIGFKLHGNKNTADNAPAAPDTATMTKTETDALTETDTTESQTTNTTTDWLTYSNFTLSYLVQYPKDAKLEDLSDPAAADIKESPCLKISNDNFYVLIGKVISDDNPPGLCFRTGVGADWTNGPSDTVTAAGMEYTANGMHTEAASAGYYKDFFMISPVDGRVKIEYGTSVNEKYGTITKAQAKDLVHKVVASYTPAE